MKASQRYSDQRMKRRESRKERREAKQECQEATITIVQTPIGYIRAGESLMQEIRAGEQT